MKGIILAGGSGSRLYPLTLAASKQLQPVYDKPMVYYPLTTLIEQGIREICLISTPEDLPRFSKLLGNGSRFGVEIQYFEQGRPNGIAEAFLIAEPFIRGDNVALILGDNIFSSIPKTAFYGGCTIFACQVDDPERYGVVELRGDGKVVSIEEKPANPKSRYAIPGFYLFDSKVAACVIHQKPSARGELEITDTIRYFINEIEVVRLPRGFAWLDAGTSTSLHEASSYVQVIEKRTGVKIGCPEEAALRTGLLTRKQFDEIVTRMPVCEYRSYLAQLA